MDNQDRPVEIKDLNKTQLILLAILLSFVTSIATGIVTISLMQQASPGTTQTINRVVQQTIEKVVPDYSPNKVQTVVVKEDDLVVDAVSKTRANLVAIMTSKDSTESITSAYSLGGGQFLVLDSAPIDATATYNIRVGKDAYDATVTGISPLGFALLTVSLDPKTQAFPKSIFGKDSDVHVGQTVVLVSDAAIAKAIVQLIKPNADTSANFFVTDPVQNISSIGALAVDLDGDVIGLVVPKGSTGAAIIGVDAVVKFVAKPSLPAPIAPQAAGI